MMTVEHREQLRHASMISARVRAERRATRAWLRDTTDTWESRDRLADLLVGDPLPHLARVEILDLLIWCHGVGVPRARQILRREGMRENKLAGTLTLRQALALAGALRQGTHELTLAVA